MMSRHRIADIETEISKVSREVVARRAGITSAVSMVLIFLVANHVVPTSWAGAATHWVDFAFDALGVLIAAAGLVWTRAGVTTADPAKGPKDILGNDLVPALVAGPHAAVEVVSSSSPVDVAPPDALAAAEAIHPVS
jgi:hypothetical protein